MRDTGASVTMIYPGVWWSPYTPTTFSPGRRSSHIIRLLKHILLIGKEEMWEAIYLLDYSGGALGKRAWLGDQY